MAVLLLITYWISIFTSGASASNIGGCGGRFSTLTQKGEVPTIIMKCVGADVGACVVGAGVGTFIRWFASGKLKAPHEKKTLAKFAEYS